jgi:nucleotide-binding universal stress UspA family protein
MKILYATDGSDAAGAAARFLELLQLGAGDSIHVVSVLSRPVPPAVDGMDVVTMTWQVMGEIYVQERGVAERVAQETASAWLARGVPASMEIREGDAAHEIVVAAEAASADLVVVGSRGLTGLDRFLLGSVARNVAKHCRQPVLVAREPRQSLARALVATDGSEHANHANAFAARLPLPAACECVAVNVVRPYAPFPGLLPTDRAEFAEAVEDVNRQHTAAAQVVANTAQDVLANAGKKASSQVRSGDPAEQVMALAEELSADLIVAGARGASLLEGLLVGSVADRLLKDAHCSVLLVR